MKLVFLAALAVVSIGVVLSCAPHTAYIKQYQMMHSGNKCVQCQEIIAHTSCTNNWHDTQFGCATPVVEYGLEPTGRCGQASMVCVPDATRPGASSVMIVALVDNSDGRFGQNAQVYAPISNMGVSSATVIEPCSMESAWMHDSLDDLPLANPLQIQCATNVAGFVLPPVEERYQMKQVAQPSPFVQPLPQTAPETYERSEVQTAEVQPVEVQPAEGHVVDEDVQVIILGTTLMPYVKERVVQRVIKEHHLYPRLHKKIVKTKHISKPTAFEREYIERVPATKIVPTFEERRATQIIRGTTLVPIVEEMEVTEILPELTETLPEITETLPAVTETLPAVTETLPAVTEASYGEQAKYVEEKVVQPAVVESGYETKP